ncbi:MULTISPECIES: 2-oxo acid dehydrogenase subunit E2 [Streptomyces]|uniref:2-oxo acid dehydrogenase subunit E2 n=1 Tax=Streptomyces TaxID=1883 RepID=UPI0004CD72E8|nr:MULTISPECIES: 2-oxo acid dehydrogenase subunit E2 [Streptomyces]KOT51370.1 dehydrogenase [Streptomyces rimosus subsp. rimosus]
MGDFTMPSLGADMEAGTLQEWLVAPGDTVNKGDPVAVVETAKSTIEVECFESGTVERLIVEPGTNVPVGTPLARIATADDTASAAAPTGSPGGLPAPDDAVASEAVPAPEAHQVRSPLVRRLAKAEGVDLADLHGSGPGGTITRTDVQRAAHSTERPATPAARRLAAELGVDLARVPGGGRDGAVRVTDVRAAAAHVPRAAGPPVPPPSGRAAPAAGDSRVRATPMARRVAAELGVDLSTVSGTGESGAVRAADVRSLAVTPYEAGHRPGTAEASPGGTAGAGPAEERVERAATVPLLGDGDRGTAMRRAIADLMSRSKHDIPHYYLSTTIDLDAALRWMREHNRRSPVAERLVPGALLLKAAALAAHQVPELNGFWTDGRFVPGPGVHLGVAVSLRGGGLIAPALHDADTLTLAHLMAGLKDLVSRTRTGRLRGSETADPTITVTSLGDQGVEAVFGVIHPPQVALVGFGRVVERPCAVNGLLGVRPAVTTTLSADHRATDGAIGARYLATVERLLQRPEEL